MRRPGENAPGLAASGGENAVRRGAFRERDHNSRGAFPFFAAAGGETAPAIRRSAGKT